jgi:hypothetical protein
VTLSVTSSEKFDVGAAMIKTPAASSSSGEASLETRDAREVCVRHGWVGRRVFQQDRHDLCEAPLEEEPAIENEVPEGETPEEEVVENAADRRRQRAERRRQGLPSKKTVPVRKLTQAELAAGRAELHALGADAPYWRPKTRGDCSKVPRPCPYVACSKHLYLDVAETGSLIFNFPHLEPDEMPPDCSCALDLAARGGMTLEDIADVTNLTRERIRQMERRALEQRARPAALELGLGVEDAAAAGTRHHVGPGEDLVESGVDGEVPSDVAALLAGGDG